MWHTNCGYRTLEGAEARLFAEALWDFVSELEVDEGVYVVPDWNYKNNLYKGRYLTKGLTLDHPVYTALVLAKNRGNRAHRTVNPMVP